MKKITKSELRQIVEEMMSGGKMNTLVESSVPDKQAIEARWPEAWQKVGLEGLTGDEGSTYWGHMKPEEKAPIQKIADTMKNDYTGKLYKDIVDEGDYPFVLEYVVDCYFGDKHACTVIEAAEFDGDNPRLSKKFAQMLMKKVAAHLGQQAKAASDGKAKAEAEAEAKAEAIKKRDAAIAKFVKKYGVTRALAAKELSYERPNLEPSTFEWELENKVRQDNKDFFNVLKKDKRFSLDKFMNESHTGKGNKMKITKTQLKQVIKEELNKIINEQEEDDAALDKLPKDFSKYKVVDVVNFLNSPVGKDPKVRALLGAGQADSAGPGDEVINVDDSAQPKVLELSPTQNEISLMKSIGWPLSTLKSVGNSLTGDITGRDKRIVTAGNLVIDGHHRWSSTWATAGKNAPIDAVDIDLPGASPLNKLAVAQVAIVGTMDPDAGNVPKATAGEGDKKSDNILGKDAGTIKQMILDREGQATEGGILLGPEYLQKIVQVPAAQEIWGLRPDMSPDEAKEQIVNIVSKNLADLPPPQGPKRDYMPQFDGGETHKGQVSMGAVIKKMKSGGVNYKAGYKPAGEKQVAENLRKLAEMLDD